MRSIFFLSALSRSGSLSLPALKLNVEKQNILRLQLYQKEVEENVLLLEPRVQHADGHWLPSLAQGHSLTHLLLDGGAQLGFGLFQQRTQLGELSPGCMQRTQKL